MKAKLETRTGLVRLAWIFLFSVAVGCICAANFHRLRGY
jgi:hypothetical protein